MTEYVLIPSLVLVGAFLLDSLVRPRRSAPYRPWRSLPASWILLLLNLTTYGAFLAICGSHVAAALLTLALQLLLALASNAKLAMLGEPLLFSDLALVGAIFRHPQFYFSALKTWQTLSICVVGFALALSLAWLFDPAPTPHIAGAAISISALALLAISLCLPPLRDLARTPRLDADTLRLGLLPSLLLYWLRWRGSESPPACPALAAAPPRGSPGDRAPGSNEPQLIVAIQCESFADPAELFGDPALRLPGLEQARLEAMQWGNLLVSGFGAYTMRTEYAVLFGRSEEDLGFRRFDPFLTASEETSYALPRRLSTERWRSLFVHPHDMRFYSRDRLLPAAGFAEMLGEESFASPAPGEGRYVTDAAVADKILGLAEAAQAPTFIYAVTIENHGPWSASKGSEPDQLVRNYIRLVRAGDAMLTRLREGLIKLERPALLAFFGDHRPSIPGASKPGGARHTPYVILQFDERGRIVRGPNRRLDLAPAQLHHAILDAALDRPNMTR